MTAEKWNAKHPIGTPLDDGPGRPALVVEIEHVEPVEADAAGGAP